MAASVSRRRQQNRDGGGYDCEFVKPPPDAFQVECPICLQVLKEPCVISCPCGQKICRECVEKTKENNKPCPFCNKTEFTFMRDYGLERYLKEQEVWCSKEKAGCVWKGKLGEYEQHLNRNPSPENQLTGCQFVEVECEHGCGEWFQRRHVISHQNQECPDRPYTCEYCLEYESTFEGVTEIHYFDCKMYLVTCRNKCREDPFKRQEIGEHISDECPLTKVNCPLHYAGCEVRLPRKDMPEHMRDTVTHLTLLATVTQTLLKENQKLQVNIEYLNKENQELKQHNQQLEVKHQELEKATQKEVEVLKKGVHELKLTLGGFPIDFHVNYAKKEKQYLPSFDTHSHGYCMCIEFHANGHKSGKGTHVSIYTRLMRSPYDDHLKWPFRGRITIQIVNQAGDHSHMEETIYYSDKTDDDTAGRVSDKKRSDHGKGFHKFLAHTDLEYNAAKNTRYLKDDIIIVRVVRVKITQ